MDYTDLMTDTVRIPGTTTSFPGRFRRPDNSAIYVSSSSVRRFNVEPGTQLEISGGCYLVRDVSRSSGLVATLSVERVQNQFSEMETALKNAHASRSLRLSGDVPVTRQDLEERLRVLRNAEGANEIIDALWTLTDALLVALEASDAALAVATLSPLMMGE